MRCLEFAAHAGQTSAGQDSSVGPWPGPLGVGDVLNGPCRRFMAIYRHGKSALVQLSHEIPPHLRYAAYERRDPNGNVVGVVAILLPLALALIIVVAVERLAVEFAKLANNSGEHVRCAAAARGAIDRLRRRVH